MANATQQALITGLVVAGAFVARPAGTVQAPTGTTQQPPSIPTERSSTGFRVAIIDSKRVVDASSFGREINARAELVVNDWETRMARSQEEHDALVRQRSSQELVLTEQALARLDDLIEQKAIEVRRLQEDASRDLQTLGQRLQEEINAALVPLLEKYAREKGFHLVLDSSRLQTNGLLYWADEFDITADFIRIIDSGASPLNKGDRGQ